MKIYNSLKDFIFIDIETVREYSTYEEFLKYRSSENWERLAKRHMEDENLTPSEAYQKKASLYVEYAKIVSFCWGRFDSEFNPTIGSISDTNELELLKRIADFLEKVYTKYPETILCGHNIKEFDIPFLIKRMIYHRINIPKILKNYISAKSWDQKATDTLYDWRMAGNRFMSLDSIAEFLSIPSSKGGVVEGNNLGDYYWFGEGNLDDRRIQIDTYCKRDVRVVMELSKRFYDVL